MGIAVRGMLHKETIYSLRQAPGEKEYTYHIRKSIESFKTKIQVDKIVDPVVKKIMEKAVIAAGGFRDGRIPSNAFVNLDQEGFKQTKLVLPNKKGGDPVPLWKIRIKESFSGAVQLKKELNRYVNPRNNHHIMIYKDSEGQLKESVVTLWEAIRRKSHQEPLYQIPKQKGSYVSSLHNNDLFLLGVMDLDDDLSKESRNYLAQHLYRLQKLSSNFYEFRLAYHNDISQVNAPEFIRITNFGSRKTGWLALSPIKVIVNYAGEIKRAPEPIMTVKNNPSMLQ